MKKYLLLLLCCLVSATAVKAQWAVVDVTAEKNAIQQIKQLKDQHHTLTEQKNKLDETLDLMRKVNGTLRNLETVKNLYEREKRLVSQCNDIVKHADDLNVEVLSQFSSTVSTILQNSNRIVRMTRTILSRDLKMNDSERLQMIKKMEEELQQEEQKVYKVNRVLYEYNQAKRMIERNTK